MRHSWLRSDIFPHLSWCRNCHMKREDTVFGTAYTRKLRLLFRGYACLTVIRDYSLDTVVSRIAPPCRLATEQPHEGP